MNALRRHLQPWTWLAVVALLAAALLPTVSHALALARGDGARWAELCTPQGMRLVALADDGNDPAPVPAASPLQHCPCCGLGAGHPALPPAAPVVLAPAPAGTTPPPPVLPAHATAAVWRSAQPRGPPSLP